MAKLIHLKPLFYRAIVGLLLSSLAAACFTTENSSTGKTHFTLEMGKAQKNGEPLPAYIPIWINWYAGDTLISKHLGFRGWDFNQDNRLDMLEVLDEFGTVTQRAYDFDLDGQVDLTQKITNHNQENR